MYSAVNKAKLGCFKNETAVRTLEDSYTPKKCTVRDIYRPR